MHEPIMANYVPDGDDWIVTVTAGARKRTAKAPGLLAARDKVDQITGQLEPEDDSRTVVHLLDGDAFAFTTAYLEARLGITAPVPAQPSHRPSPAERPKPAAKPEQDLAPAATTASAPASAARRHEKPDGN